MERNFDKITAALDLFSEGGENDIDGCIQDLLTDLRHLCAFQKADFDKTILMSEIHFDAESPAGDPEPETPIDIWGDDPDFPVSD